MHTIRDTYKVRERLLAKVRNSTLVQALRGGAATRSCVVAATTLIAALAVAILVLTAFDPKWTMFLCGMLAAALLASWSHGANARWTIARRTAQLRAAREKLAAAAHQLARAEESLARFERTARFLDDAFPSMVLYIDAEGVVRYHNRAYARWNRMSDIQIDGRRLEEIVGRATHAEIQARVDEALGGREVRYERTQIMSDGERCRLFVQYLPHFAEQGKVAGIFALMSDITAVRELGPPAAKDDPHVDADAAARLVATLEKDEFCLYSQPIVPLGRTDDAGTCMEVLLRLREEEENHLPAGMFLPAAEDAGLMPQIDRWVVRKVLAAAGDPSRTFFVNVSPSTIEEAGFAEFVDAELVARGRSGRSLCFEFAERDVIANPCAYRDFTAALAPRGCRFAVSGSTCNRLAVPLLGQMNVSFLKLDGCIVLNALRDGAELERIAATNTAAHAAGMRTVAECVEDEATRSALQLAGTDYVQGFGIAVPRILNIPAPTPFALEKAA